MWNKLIKMKFLLYSQYYHETSGEAHLCGLAPGQHSNDETSQLWWAVGDTVSDLAGPGIEPQTYGAESDDFKNCANRLCKCKTFSCQYRLFKFKRRSQCQERSWRESCLALWPKSRKSTLTTWLSGTINQRQKDGGTIVRTWSNLIPSQTLWFYSMLSQTSKIGQKFQCSE